MINKLTGDVTTPQGSGSQPATIAPGSVTFAKMATGTVRELLTANRTYYVRTDGSDANTGLVNTAGGAFLTLQKAIDVVAALDISIFDVTIQLGNGTYIAANTNAKMPVGAGTITVRGDPTTPSNVVLQGQNLFDLGVFRYVYTGVRLQNAGGICIQCKGGAMRFVSVEFGVAAWHMYIWQNGNITLLGTDAYAIVGAANYHVYTAAGGKFTSPNGSTVTITGTPAWGSTFAGCDDQSFQQWFGTTFSGAATGSRYIVQRGSIINTLASGATYLPGNIAGTAVAANGGYYI